jgi:glycosyltransferase involved in cell wall biosynthesis
MKILYYNPFLNAPHGASVHGLHLIKEIEKSNNQIFILPGLNHKKIVSTNVRSKFSLKLPRFFCDSCIIVGRKIQTLYVLEMIKRTISKTNPDFIIIRQDIGEYFPILLKKEIKIPIILEVNSPTYYEASKYGCSKFFLRYLKSIETQCWEYADAIYAVSNVLHDFICNENPALREKIWVIPNGVDLQKFNEMRCQQTLVKKDRNLIKVGFIGSFQVWHGLDFILHVFSDVIQARPNTELILIGEGAYKKRKELSISKNRILEDKVKFLPHMSYDEIVINLLEIDILVAPYLYQEYFYFSPLKIFDYMAAGKAIVTSNIGQIGEILINDKEAILVKPGNHNDYVEALINLIDSEDKRRFLGNNALKKVEFYTWENAAKTLLFKLSTLRS